jgi:poly-beta-1,6-N-acetyl-D-glucosamine synthase
VSDKLPRASPGRPLAPAIYVVITPVRNEARFIANTIASMVAQTIRPVQWVIVDDGSSDGTPEIVDAAAREHRWITGVRRSDRGFRKSGGGVVEAFYDGYQKLASSSWEFIVKLDGDLTFAPDYFETCIARFRENDKLGIGGGTILVRENDKVRVDSPGDPPFHVRGATKIYRRACWEQISPLVQAPGWDTIDEVRANMRGWHTLTFRGANLLQQRATGAEDGQWCNWYKNGVANYVTGYHPLFMLAKCIKRTFGSAPLAGVALGAGFCAGYLKGLPQVNDVEAVRYLRGQQLLRLLSRESIYTPSAASDSATDGRCQSAARV